MHITRTNNALDEENPHICIGWGKLGDLSEIDTKEALSTLYDTQFEKTKMGKAQDISQIWTFRGIMNPGDYVVFGDGGIAHIGRIVSDYYYDTTNENQDEDYVNNRKVEWLKSIPYADLPTNLRKSVFSQRSIFSLNDYKSVIIDLLNDKYVEAIEEEIAVFIPYTYDTTKGGAQNKVFYGTPGCGKSYYVQNRYLNDIGVEKENRIRTTFYQDYTNTDFVGQILPKVHEDKTVTYEFNPGPFALALKMAIENPDKRVYS